jgi:hypothetical protein
MKQEITIQQINGWGTKSRHCPMHSRMEWPKLGHMDTCTHSQIQISARNLDTQTCVPIPIHMTGRNPDTDRFTARNPQGDTSLMIFLGHYTHNHSHDHPHPCPHSGQHPLTKIRCATVVRHNQRHGITPYIYAHNYTQGMQIHEDATWSLYLPALPNRGHGSSNPQI